MNTAVPIDDETLGAWLDGALPAHDQARVAAWLADHPDDAARVRQWADDAERLRQHSSTVLQEPVPAALRDTVVGHGLAGATSPRWRQAAMAAGLLLAGAALGAGSLWQWQRSNTPVLARAGGWVQRAAYAHSVYVPEPRHAVEVKAQEEHLARWLTRRIDVPVKLFDLHAQGFDLVGGRLLPDDAGKSAQLMYQDAQGVRVTVYLRKPEPGTMAAFRYERQGELGLFYWVEEGCGYALVGALPRETLLALAQNIYNQHPVSSAPAK
jgi:anti-sigma factor RsiW